MVDYSQFGVLSVGLYTHREGVPGSFSANIARDQLGESIGDSHFNGEFNASIGIAEW